MISTRRLRPFAALALLLQLSLSGFSPQVEAAAELREGLLGTHVESEGTDDCPSVHDHLNCVVCRALSLGGLPGPVADVAFVNTERPFPSHHVVDVQTNFSFPAHSPRGPPIS